MITVELDIFSGRPNPIFIIDNDEARALLKIISDNPTIITNKTGIQRLGYRGIKITILEETAQEFGLPTEFFIANGASDNETKGLEIVAQLIEKRPDDILAPDLKKLIIDQLAKFPNFVSAIQQQGRNLQQESVDTTLVDTALNAAIQYEKYNPEYWNKNETVLRTNNCYAYACMSPTNTWPQPGRAHGYKLQQKQGLYHIEYKDCSTVLQWAQIDGLSLKPISPCYHVALVIWPDIDYHWYRRVIDNISPSSQKIWAHKVSNTEVTNKDDSGQIITDPQKADRGHYTLWCSYMYYPTSGIEIV